MSADRVEIRRPHVLLLVCLLGALGLAHAWRGRPADARAALAPAPSKTGVDAAPLYAWGREEVHAIAVAFIRFDRFLRHRAAVDRRLAWRQTVRHETEAAFAQLLARGTVLDHIRGKQKRIALTLDDGPSPLTPRTLAILARRHVPATFFLVGHNVARYPRFLELIREGGHEIENHTWSHELGYPYTSTQFTSSPLAHQLDELARTDRKLHDRTRFMRAPGGLFGPCWGTVEAAREMGKVIVNWDVAGDTPGWQHIANGRIVDMEPADVLNNYEAQVAAGSIILMHPENKADAPYTIEILDRFIVDMQKKGYKFVTLDEMLRPEDAVAAR